MMRPAFTGEQIMRKLIPCLLVVGVVAIAGCKKEGSGTSGPGIVAADDPLTYVPSDTPYVFANIDPVPAEVSEAWVAKMGKYGDMVASQLDNASKIISKEDANCAIAAGNSGGGGAVMQDAPSGQDASADKSASGDANVSAPQTDMKPADATGTDASAIASGDPRCSPARMAERGKALKLINAVKGEVAGKDLKGVMDLVGVSPQTHFAFYGIGLVPVARLELAKPDNLRGTIGRLETASGSKLATGKIGNLDYWIVDGGDMNAKLHVVFAISGKQLVATVAPAKASDADMRILMGLDKPAKTLADSGDLGTLNKKMSYLSYGSGYFDSTRLVAVLKAPPTPLETSFLTAMETTKPTVDAVCSAEYDQIAAAWPRVSMGYTDLSAKQMSLRGVLEARADIAKDLMTLRAPMPGLNAAKDSMFDFGFSANLTKLPELATKYADATAKAPWKCPSLTNMNQSAEQSKTSLTNPAFAGYAPMFHGFHAIVDKFVMKDDQPIPDIAAVVAIGSDNPASLFQMAGSISPDIAKVGLKPDGKPIALPPLPNMQINAPLFAAMTDKQLAISIGAGEEAKLGDAMKIDDTQQPLFAFGAKGDLYHLIAQFERKSAKTMADPEAQHMMEEQAKMMDMYADWFKHVDARVELTEQGIEFREMVDMQ